SPVCASFQSYTMNVTMRPHPNPTLEQDFCSGGAKRTYWELSGFSGETMLDMLLSIQCDRRVAGPANKPAVPEASARS
ncbi:MAG: hypothetical protein ABL967_20580, partial [Bryobacteraceae bacterium]